MIAINSKMPATKGEEEFLLLLIIIIIIIIISNFFQWDRGRHRIQNSQSFFSRRPNSTKAGHQNQKELLQTTTNQNTVIQQKEEEEKLKIFCKFFRNQDQPGPSVDKKTVDWKVEPTPDGKGFSMVLPGHKKIGRIYWMFDLLE